MFKHSEAAVQNILLKYMYFQNVIFLR